jgi:hypothetical protein
MSRVRDFRTITSESEDLNKVQQNVTNALEPLINSPLNNCVILENVAVGTSATEIMHKLGRTLRGWTVIRQRADSRIWDVQDTNQRPKTTLLLQASTSVVVDLLVF